MRRPLSFSSIKLSLALGALACLAILPTSVMGQGPAVHDNVTINGGGGLFPSFVIKPFSGSKGGLDIDTPAGNGAVTITATTPDGVLAIDTNGVGIGFDGFAGTTGFPTSPLHVVGGGAVFSGDAAFASAHVLIEDRNASVGQRELLRLTNNGATGIRIEDRSSDTFFRMENVIGLFELASGPLANPSGPVHFRVNKNSPNNTLNLAPNGVGIGTGSPISALHVFADGTDFTSATIRGEVTNANIAKDRLMLDLRNNGAVVMNLLDTSVPGAMPFQIRSSQDRFSVQQFGGNRAGFAVFNDGAIRYVANGQPNLTVTGNGTMNVIGQGSGGNLNVIGPAGGAGNLFVKGNIRYNGSLSGPSDRNIKENFKQIDPKDILSKVVDLPITRWNYIDDKNDIPHLGPMAQDFYAAFKLGDDNKRIPLMDNTGVALAAIQGLNEVVEAKDKKIAELDESLQDQSELILELTERLERLESMVMPTQK